MDDNKIGSSPTNPLCIMWSGGYDSTALILKAIQENKYFSTLAITLENNECQVKAEKFARKVLREYITSYLPEHRWNEHIERQLYGPVNAKNVALPQAVMWVGAAVAYCSANKIQLGYVKGDCFWHFKTEALRLADSHYFDPTQPKLELEFPFEWMEKEELFPYYNALPGCLQYLSVCEDGAPWLTDPSSKAKYMRRLIKQYRRVRTAFACVGEDAPKDKTSTVC